MSVSLFTGFPGFLGVELLPRVLRRDRQRRAVCLVQAKLAGLARRKANELVAADTSLEGRITFVEGDITVPDLGLPAGIAANLTEIWHLAAVFDISVPRDLGMHVNVEGTCHVCDLARSFPRPHAAALYEYVLRERSPRGRLRRGRPRRQPAIQQFLRGNPNSSPRPRYSGGAGQGCPRPYIVRPSSWVTAPPARRRSTMGSTSRYSGCCGSHALP